MAKGSTPPPVDQELTARVAALEDRMFDVETRVGDLEARVGALEEGEEPPPIEPPIDPPPVTVGNLSVELDLPGGRLTFAQSQATDAGDYIGQHVHQRCLRLRQGAWTVFFRPDADGSRNEVVVEYGGYDFSKSTHVPPVPPIPVITPVHILQPYTATIRDDTGTTVATVTVPKQWWCSRWRWQSAPRPLVRNYADLLGLRAVLPLDKRAVWNTPLPPAYPWTGPMGTAGLTVALGTTGDRPEIGFVTEHQASYFLNGDSNSLTTLLAQGEAVGSWPIWFRDINGSLLDVFHNPYLALNDAFGGDHRLVVPPAPPNDPDWFSMDESHLPAAAFVPYLLTDDPYFLEGMQVAGNYHIIATNYNTNQEQLPGMCTVVQTRAWGWGVRDQLRLVAFTPAGVPSYLQPNGYWQECSQDTRTFAGRYLASTAPAVSRFHMITDSGFLSSFMMDYIQMTIGWVGWSGLFPEWDETVEWVADPRIAMGDDEGWDRRYLCPYQVPIANAKLGAGAPLINAYYTSTVDPALTPADWAELWLCYLAWSGVNPATFEPDKLAPGQDLGHLSETRGALAALSLAGVTGAATVHDWMFGDLPRVLGSGYASRFKWAVWPG